MSMSIKYVIRKQPLFSFRKRKTLRNNETRQIKLPFKDTTKAATKVPLTAISFLSAQRLRTNARTFWAWQRRRFQAFLTVSLPTTVLTRSSELQAVPVKLGSSLLFGDHGNVSRFQRGLSFLRVLFLRLQEKRQEVIRIDSRHWWQLFSSDCCHKTTWIIVEVSWLMSHHMFRQLAHNEQTS